MDLEKFDRVTKPDTSAQDKLKNLDVHAILKKSAKDLRSIKYYANRCVSSHNEDA